jgi:hypothetical protein
MPNHPQRMSDLSVIIVSFLDRSAYRSLAIARTVFDSCLVSSGGSMKPRPGKGLLS